MRPIIQFGVTGERLQCRAPLGIELDLGIDTTNAIGAYQAAIVSTRALSGSRAQLAVGVNQPHRGLLAYIAVHP